MSMSQPGLPKWVIILGSILYVFSPIDLVPEALLGPFGLADDLIAAIIGVRALMQRKQSSI